MRLTERGDVLKRIRERFTMWYVKKGYKFGYRPCKVYADGILTTPLEIPETYFICPWYVKPLLIFFSPSVYMKDAMGKAIVEAFRKGLEEAKMKGVI